ncbi:MAG: hypothetical protein NWE99_10790 [Candidatus Bathyarchaeota archaeon]|nr:hypothetical protein [Candidatus Bathyarchaeota archaeon]
MSKNTWLKLPIKLLRNMLSMEYLIFVGLSLKELYVDHNPSWKTCSTEYTAKLIKTG